MSLTAKEEEQLRALGFVKTPSGAWKSGPEPDAATVTLQVKPDRVVVDPQPAPPIETHEAPGTWAFGPCTVKGQLGSKSNSRKIVTVGAKFQALAPGGKKVRMGGRPALVKSEDALAYVQAFRLQVRNLLPKEPYPGTVALRVVAYYVDRVRDLDIALLQDCLQADPKHGWPGILKNDRQVVEIHAWRRIDKTNPRVVFDLKAVTEKP